MSTRWQLALLGPISEVPSSQLLSQDLAHSPSVTSPMPGRRPLERPDCFHLSEPESPGPRGGPPGVSEVLWPSRLSGPFDTRNVNNEVLRGALAVQLELGGRVGVEEKRSSSRNLFCGSATEKGPGRGWVSTWGPKLAAGAQLVTSHPCAPRDYCGCADVAQLSLTLKVNSSDPRPRSSAYMLLVTRRSLSPTAALYCGTDLAVRNPRSRHLELVRASQFLHECHSPSEIWQESLHHFSSQVLQQLLL